jgi:dienelactone hydrolase
MRESLGEVPVVLVGHSMGGRTACHTADHALVAGVVALAPWLPPDEPVEPLAGKELHAAHGRRDRITRARDTQAYVERAAEVTRAASFTDMGDRGHYLLGGVHAWNAFAVDRVRRIL